MPYLFVLNQERNLFMNYLGIYKTSLVDGIGWRTVLFVSGCNHKCVGCHNPQSHDAKAGTKFTEKTKQFIYDQMTDIMDGITLSGGDPLYKTNQKEITQFCKEFKEKFPNKTIWLYTGSLYEDVKDLEVMQYIDVIVDGPFVLAQRDTTIPFRGSTNQRVIDVKNNKILYS